jgi:hypothetical protein
MWIHILQVLVLAIGYWFAYRWGYFAAWLEILRAEKKKAAGD